MAITCRRFQTEEDYFSLREFIEKSIAASGNTFYFNLNDLEFLFDLYEGKSHLQAIKEQLDDLFLWYEGEKIIGGIFVYNRVQLFIDSTKKYLFSEMFKTASEAVNKYIKESKLDINISNFSECSWRIFEGDSELENVLIQDEYYKTDEYWVSRYFDYTQSLEKSNLPEGYSIKTLSEISNVNKVAEIYNKCLGMDMDEFTLRHANVFDTYRDELDIVVMNQENEPVALCSGRYDEKNKMASFEAIACLKDYRKKGISKAMILYALRAARDLGASVSTVFTLCPEKFPAPNRLYEAAGFKLVGKRYTWEKHI